MKVGILTSSRADFGIYLSLLKKICKDPFFQIEIIAFGTHLSRYHGYTIQAIKEEAGFDTIHAISTLLTNDDETSISTAYGLTALKFADFWSQNQYDWILCLGDRFEMAAAVQAGIPFRQKFAHIHGGETTLGAIDNIYRHQITLASSKHFTATELFSSRIEEITGSPANIYTVGSLSIDELKDLPIISEKQFREQYNIANDFALLTFHPETESPGKNHDLANEMYAALTEISKKIFLVVTMPNADTYGTVFRKALLLLKETNPRQVELIENFGKLNYFAAMRYCRLLIGNTSSGIIEAASFGKYVINVGDRQKGRARSKNVIDVPFNSAEMMTAYTSASQKGVYTGNNIYQRNGTADLIIQHLKQ